MSVKDEITNLAEKLYGSNIRISKFDILEVLDNAFEELEKAEKVIEAADEIVGYEYTDMGCRYDGCDLSDFGSDVKKLDEALKEYRNKEAV